jgi:N-acyl-D-amino-acid deacylase
MESDAYATGQVLTFWKTISSRPLQSIVDSDPYRAASQFLIRTQSEDGSWHVVSRSKPVQLFFDNGDPHGKDQFLSMMATSWAVMGLDQHQPAPLHSSRFRSMYQRDHSVRDRLPSR